MQALSLGERVGGSHRAFSGSNAYWRMRQGAIWMLYYFLPRNWRAPRQTPLQLTTLSSLSQGKSAQSAAMDSPIVAQLFRQLFRHRPQGCQGRLNPICNGFNTVPRLRSYATRASIDRGMKTNESRWQQRTHILPEDRTEEFAQYPYISMNELKQRSERPRRVKMLLRDFIDGTITTSD